MDENLRQVEQRLDVQVRRRGGWFEVSGRRSATQRGRARAAAICSSCRRSEALTPDRVHLALQEAGMEPAPVVVHARRRTR